MTKEMSKQMLEFTRSQKKAFIHEVKEPRFFFNEYDLTIPKKETWYQRNFPNRVVLLIIACSLVKILLFLYGVWFYSNGINVTKSNIFAEWASVWWNPEGLSDFAGDYIMFRQNFLNGELLYSDAFNGRYLYPPIYYYLINIFSSWTIYSAPIIMLISNIAMGYLVFRIAKQWGANSTQAKLAMILVLLSPINLYYSDLIWQNATVFTVFVIWCIYKLNKGQYKWAMFLLGIAISIKQVALFFFPIFLFGIIYKKHFKSKEKWQSKIKLFEYIKSIPWSDIFIYAVIVIEVFLFSSLPYILLDPVKYFSVLGGGLGGENIEYLSNIFNNLVPIYAENEFVGYFPDLSLYNSENYYRVNYRAVMDVAFAWICFKLGLPSIVWVIFSIVFHFQGFLLLSLAIIFLCYWRIIKTRRYRTDTEYHWLMAYAGFLMFFASLLFTEIGIYKYYLVSMTPFWALFSNTGFLDHERWKNARTFRNQLYGCGSWFHIVFQLSVQILIIYSNKWLAPLLLYLPLLLVNIWSLYERSRPHKKYPTKN